MTKIFGIVNLTEDSFSDGGRYLSRDAALAHALALQLDGADVIDLGAESTHPSAGDVSPEVEIARLAPLIAELVERDIPVSVDTRKPEVMRTAVALGASYINDVNGLRDPAAIEAVADSAARLIVMHSLSEAGRAQRPESDPGRIVGQARAFFEERLATLGASGIAAERIILDPGMGLFVGNDPQASVRLLQALPALRALGCPIMVSVSRKSFLGALAGEPDAPLTIAERGAATLAAELWAARNGADLIRTHDAGSLVQALRIDAALRAARHD